MPPEAAATVLVTGCGGFLAGALLRHLPHTWPQARCVGLGRRPSAHGAGAPVLALDLNDGPALRDALQALQPDVVLHAAGRLQAPDWATFYRDNVQATIGLLEALQAVAPRARTVVVGSAAECGLVEAAQLPVREADPLAPVTPYGVSKAWQSLAVRALAHAGHDVVLARVFNIVGAGMPDNTSLGSFAAQLRKIAAGRQAPVLRVGALAARRDFVDTRDIATALQALARQGRCGEVYNVCSGRAVRIGDALDALVQASGLPVRIAADAARLRPADVPVVVGSADKIGRECGWAAQVPLATSLAAMLQAPAA